MAVGVAAAETAAGHAAIAPRGAAMPAPLIPGAARPSAIAPVR